MHVRDIFFSKDMGLLCVVPPEVCGLDCGLVVVGHCSTSCRLGGQPRSTLRAEGIEFGNVRWCACQV